MYKQLYSSYICCIICSFFFVPTIALAEQIDEQNEQTDDHLYDRLLEKLAVDELDKHWQTIRYEYSEFLPSTSRKNIVELMKHNDEITIKSTIKGMIRYLFYEIIANGKLLGALMMLTLFSIVLQSIQGAFEKSTVSKIASFVIYIVLISITLNSFHLVFTYAKDTIMQMSHFMIALIPLMLGLIASVGQVFTVTFFHPIIIFLIHISGVIMTTFIFPLLYLSAILIVISHLNTKFKAVHLAELFKTISLTTIGVFLTVFLGVMSVQGTATAIQDGIALKTTKFITGNFIPIVGRTFTDAAETVLSAALLLKNAVGLVGLAIIIFIAIFPAIKIMAISFIYKLAAALLQPLGDNLIVQSLNTISKYIMYVLACLITVTFMFFLAIVIITVASNIPILLQ